MKITKLSLLTLALMTASFSVKASAEDPVGPSAGTAQPVAQHSLEAENAALRAQLAALQAQHTALQIEVGTLSKEQASALMKQLAILRYEYALVRSDRQRELFAPDIKYSENVSSCANPGAFQFFYRANTKGEAFYTQRLASLAAQARALQPKIQALQKDLTDDCFDLEKPLNIPFSQGFFSIRTATGQVTQYTPSRTCREWFVPWDAQEGAAPKFGTLLVPITPDQILLSEDIRTLNMAGYLPLSPVPFRWSCQTHSDAAYIPGYAELDSIKSATQIHYLRTQYKLDKLFKKNKLLFTSLRVLDVTDDSFIRSIDNIVSGGAGLIREDYLKRELKDMFARVKGQASDLNLLRVRVGQNFYAWNRDGQFMESVLVDLKQKDDAPSSASAQSLQDPKE